MKIVNGVPAPGEKLDDETREKMRRQAELLKQIEMPADCEPWGEQRAQQLTRINQRRKLHGLEPFENDEEKNPELAKTREAAYRRYVSTGR